MFKDGFQGVSKKLTRILIFLGFLIVILGFSRASHSYTRIF